MGITYTQEQVEEMFRAYINNKLPEKFPFNTADFGKVWDEYNTKIPQEIRIKIRRLEEEAGEKLLELRKNREKEQSHKV